MPDEAEKSQPAKRARKTADPAASEQSEVSGGVGEEEEDGGQTEESGEASAAEPERAVISAKPRKPQTSERESVETTSQAEPKRRSLAEILRFDDKSGKRRR